MEANKTAASSVTVSISLSRKEQGALYMKSLRQAERIKELKEVNADLVKALQDASEILHLINNDGEYDAECKACRAALSSVGAA